MELVTTTKLTLPSSESITYFGPLSMEMLDEGLLIKGRSPLFAKFIQERYASPPEEVPSFKTKWGKAESFLQLKTAFPPNGISAFIRYGEPNYFQDAEPNMIWLLHRDLATGFSLLVEQPISLNNFEDYFTSCCAAIQDIYTKFLRKASAEATFAEVWGKP